MDKQALKDQVEQARAKLLDALDQLDGVDDDRFDPAGVRDRIAAEIARGQAKARANPMLAIAACTALGVMIGFGSAFAFAKRLICG